MQAWLAAQEGRDAEFVESSSAVAGSQVRFVAPLRVAGPCLACHGDEEGLDGELRELLSERYPHDEATGYREGDLRGAIWAELSLQPSDALVP